MNTLCCQAFALKVHLLGKEYVIKLFKRLCAHTIKGIFILGPFRETKRSMYTFLYKYKRKETNMCGVENKTQAKNLRIFMYKLLFCQIIDICCLLAGLYQD